MTAERYRPATEILLVLCGALLLAAAVAGPVKPLADALARSGSTGRRLLAYDAASGRYNFARVPRLLFLVFAVSGVALRRRRIGAGALLREGFRRDRRPWRSLGAGVAVGLLSVATLVALLWLLGVRRFHPWGEIVRRSGGGGRLLSAVVAAAGAAFFEETIFRGLLLGALLRSRRTAAAVVIADIAFVVPHFLSGASYQAPGADLWAGFRAMGTSVVEVANRAETPLLAAGLLGLGAVLCLAFVGSGRLYVGMGLHGGWVLATLLSCMLLRKPLGFGPRWLWGGRTLLDGAFVWLMLPPVVAWLRCRARKRGAIETGRD